MTDKEKRELKDGVISIFKNFNILDHTATIGGLQNDILRYINSLQEKPVSIWHDASEKPEHEDLLIETNDGRIIHRQSINNYGMVKKWAYTSDLLNLDNSCNFGKKSQEKTVSIDFEQELYKAFGQVKDFTLGMRIAKWFYDIGYHQAEKDLELTWEDIEIIVNIDKDTDNEESIIGVRSNEEHYREVLKRFKDLKEREEK